MERQRQQLHGLTRQRNARPLHRDAPVIEGCKRLEFHLHELSDRDRLVVVSREKTLHARKGAKPAIELRRITIER